MRKWIFWAMALLAAMPLAAAGKGKAPQSADQAIATWTEKEPGGDPNWHTEHSLSLHAGTVQAAAILFDPDLASLYPNGAKAQREIKISRIKAIDTGQLPTSQYRIGIDAIGQQDLANIEYIVSGGKHVSHWGSREDFVLFDSNQKALRDEVYGKLCALVSAGVCVGERK